MAPMSQDEIDAKRAGYEARARANNPSLTGLRPTGPAPAAAAPAEPEIGGEPAGEQPDGDENALSGLSGPGITEPDDNGNIDLLAYGRANGIARPAGGRPQSESNDPLAGGRPSVLGGQSVPARQFGGPLSSNLNRRTSRTGLRAARSAVA